jgi:hypothetical protein
LAYYVSKETYIGVDVHSVRPGYRYTCVKRDLLCVKRDLRVKRDLYRCRGIQSQTRVYIGEQGYMD